ncbi:aldo/keto reductase, partial [Methylobacterium aquaticum]
ATPRRHARTGVTVTALGLGGAQMGGLFQATSLDEAAGAFRAAWDRGVRYYDTAPFYGFTRAERRLGTLLTEQPRDRYIVSTKVGRVMVPDPTVGPMEEGYADPLPFRPTFDYSHDGVLRAFEASRQRLGLLAPDILYVHDIGRVTHGERHAHHWEQLTTGGGFRALMRLREEGAVRAVGLGVNEWEIVADAIAVADLDLCMLAGRYTLLEQDSLPLMDACARRGIGIAVAGAFNSGLLAGQTTYNYAEAPPALVARTQTLRAACAEEGVRLEAAALQFPLLHPATLTVVTGTRNAAQVEANTTWFADALPDGFWARLKARGLIDEAAPI